LQLTHKLLGIGKRVPEPTQSNDSR